MWRGRSIVGVVAVVWVALIAVALARIGPAGAHASSRPRDQLVFDGQSFNFYPLEVSTAPYPQQLIRMLGPRVGVTAVAGISNTSYAERSWSVGARVDSRYPHAQRTTVLDLAGQNELLAGMDAVHLFKLVAAYADARHRAGAKYVIEYTITPSTRYTPAIDAQRTAYNRLLVANSGHHFDGVIDLARRSQLSNPSDSRFFEDGLHPTQAGAAIIASMARARLHTLLGV